MVFSNRLSLAWQTENPDVRLFGYEDIWNKPDSAEVVLAPGESYKKSVKVWVLSSILTNQASFSLGFTPFVDRERPFSNRLKRKCYWSNKVKLDLVAPVKETAPFKIIVMPATNQVHSGEKFKVRLRVTNITSTNQYFDTMSCGWDGNWRTDSLVVGFESWGCDANIEYHVELAPGKSWENDLDLMVNESVATIKVLFRMGFIPTGGLAPRDPNPEKWKFYWSDFVTMNLIPK